MNLIILTWDNLIDIDVVRNEKGDPRIFTSHRDIDEWVEEGWHLLCRKSKVVTLDDNMSPT